MKKEKINGDYTIDADLEFHGMVTGNATVIKNVNLILHGMICKSLSVEKDGFAVIYGTISGDLVNKGGRVEVFGMVNGKLIENYGETIIHSGAVINGVKKP